MNSESTSFWKNPEFYVSLLTAVGAVATAVLVLIAVKEMEQDHERSRRENAINLIRETTALIKANQYPCLEFVSAISEDAAEELFSKRISPLALPADERVKKYLEICLPEDLLSNEENLESNSLSYKSKGYISTEVTSLLNTLEYISSAWRYSTASGPIIHEQFGQVLLSDTLNFVVSKLKRTRHRNAFPSLYFVVDHRKILGPSPAAPELGRL